MSIGRFVKCKRVTKRIQTTGVRLVLARTEGRYVRGGASEWPRSRLKASAAVANVVLLGFLFWATVASFPCPEGSVVVAFAAACVFAPVLNLLVLLRPGKSLKTAV
jgi:hypothetical protein